MKNTKIADWYIENYASGDFADYAREDAGSFPDMTFEELNFTYIVDEGIIHWDVKKETRWLIYQDTLVRDRIIEEAVRLARMEQEGN